MTMGGYLNSRKKWERPQALILSNNFGGMINGIPQIDGIEREDFIILSDHNRSEINITPTRIENRKRMANAHMRSYHIADKLSISTSWTNIPSRAFNKDPQFSTNEDVTIGNPMASDLLEYTVDGGAGGEDLLRWYQENTGSFFVIMSYDNPNNFTADPYSSDNMKKYSHAVEVMFTSFEYNIVKRGGGLSPNYDLWNVSLAFEEV